MTMIWYACYGSNMNLKRFLLYLQGGKLLVNGQEKSYTSCIDDTQEPRDTEPYIIRRYLYFAKESKTWDQHGVAFISTEEDMECFTYARLYLISRKQFEHLYAVENSRRTTSINYDILNEQKYQDFDYSFYNRIIQLEDSYRGYPILTFTNKEIMPSNKPLQEYAQLIAAGINEVRQVGKDDLKSYFKTCGIELELE